MNMPNTIETAGQRAELERQQAATAATVDFIGELLWWALIVGGAVLLSNLSY